MKRPKHRKRRLTRTVKIGISLPKDQLEYVDDIAEVSEVTRSEVFQWILVALMEDEDIEDAVFPTLSEEDIEDLHDRGIISDEDYASLQEEVESESED